MNQLEALQKLYVKTKTIKIPKNPKEGQVQVELVIEPLALDDLALFGSMTDKNADPKESSKVLKKILSKSLNVDEEQISKISMEFLTDIMDEFMKINNMSDEEKNKTSKIANFIQQKKNNSVPKVSEELKVTPLE